MGAAGIGTLCFALMLVPQVALNTRRRSTEGGVFREKVGLRILTRGRFRKLMGG